MTILIVGASGATGKHLVEQLLTHGHHVKAIVRSSDAVPDYLKNHKNMSILQRAVLDLTNQEMQHYVNGCDAIASCLGHNITFKGMFGKPRKLVTDATRRLCSAVQANKPKVPVKFVLMNTTGNRNRDTNEVHSLGEKIVIGLLRLLLPPHVDNEKAADFLRLNIGQQNDMIEWAAVRPDNLTNEDDISEYDIHPSPIRSGIFDPGKTSRINVAHFMAELMTNDDTWQKWQGQMPVIYNIEHNERTT